MSNNKPTSNQSLRRHFSPADKIKILRLHLLEKIPISEVCEKHDITPTQFYQWQKIFFENGAAAFAQSAGSRATSQSELYWEVLLLNPNEVFPAAKLRR